MGKVLTIAESINIMSKTIGPAIKARDPKPIQKMAEEELKAGADMLDLNLGPARKAGDELMEWLVKTVQEVDPNVRLSLDTTNAEAIKAGLKVCNNRALINSISAQTQSLKEKMPLAKEFDADFVALTLSQEGIPRDANERGVCAVEIMNKAMELEIPIERMWIDPIVLPISVDPNQVAAFFEFLPMIPDIAPGAHSTCGLSNISNGTPTNLRPYLNRAALALYKYLGLYSAIIDAYDKELMAICKDEMPWVDELAKKFWEREEVDESSLSKEEMNYWKSFKVLRGDVLYSHSWLEL